MAELASHWSSWWPILPVPETNVVSHWCWMNDNVRSLVEPFLIHFTAHFTTLLCRHSTSRIYSSILLTHLQNKSTNKKGMMGTMKRSVFEGFRTLKNKNTFGDDSRLFPSHLCCWSYLPAFEKSLTTCFWKSFENVLQKRAFDTILSNAKRFVWNK